ncbi:MAG: hypothetical protein Q9222_003463 [Ikaeria aurantiellina]
MVDVEPADPFLIVSWAYGGGRPGGEVAEKKDEGEIAIQSKRGNTIKRNAEPENPAVHVTRPGNDVVKRQSELDVEEKTGGDGADDAKDDQGDAAEGKGEGNLGVPETNGESKEKSKSPAPKKSPATKATPASKKRKAEEEKPQDEGAAEPAAKKARGRPKGAAKADAKAPASKEKKPAAKKTDAAAPKDGASAEAKKRGRPKGSGNGATGSKKAKEKKPPAKAVNGTVGSRTRSTKK